MPEHSDGFTRREAVAAAAASSVIGAVSTPAQAETRPGDVPGPGFKKAYADGLYGQIHYRYARPANATKVPLVCLHASPLSGIVYDNWIVEMGKDRIALAPDTPGNGGSDAPPQVAEIPDLARNMIRFMDEMKIDRGDVMGYHTGSNIAIEMARSFPDRVRKVVLISATIYTPEERAKRKEGQAAPTPTFDVMLDRAAENWRTQGKGMFRDVPTDDRYIDMRIETIRRFRTSNWGFRAVYNFDFAEAMKQAKQPVLVLNPEDDLWTMTPRAKPYLNKDSRIHDLPGWTHGHLDAHTQEMAAVVRAFLDA